MGDYSNNYTEAKKGYIIFSTEEGKRITKFKPFLDTFGYEISVSYAKPAEEDAFDIYTGAPVTETFNHSKYSIGFFVVAANVDEAIENHKKFQILARLVAPSRESVTTLKKIGVKFSNLISKDGSRGLNRPSASQAAARSVVGVIKDLQYTPEMESGFFFHKGLMFAKSFKLDISLETTGQQDNTNPQIFRSGYTYT